MIDAELPVGKTVNLTGEASRPAHRLLKGKYISLDAIDLARDTHDLFDCSHGSDDVESLWTYMGYGPSVPNC